MDPTVAAEHEGDALRVQAAAVAAQQAALLEEEARLQLQQDALTQQQNQLATHLEEKRQRLVQLADQVQAARAALKCEREDQARLAARQAQELTRGQAALEEASQKLQRDQQRVLRLRKRLKQRFHRRWSAERHKIRKREAAVVAERHQLEQEIDNLHHERDALTRTRLSFNGDMELGKRQIQADRQALALEQKQGHEAQDRKEAELAGRVRALRQREAALADAERLLADDRHQWERRRKVAEQEIHGLEARVVNQRRKLQEQARALNICEDLAQLPEAIFVGVVPDEPLVVHPALPLELELQSRAAELDGLADELADQRLQLIEHWQRLAEAHCEWQVDRDAAADELDALIAGWPDKEQALLIRHEALQVAEADLYQRQRELSGFRQHLEAWAARIRLRETTWEADRDRVLADAHSREEVADKHLQALIDLRQGWSKRRRDELELLRTERDACEKLRQEYATLRQECFKRGLSLQEQQRELSEKTLAMEEYRQRFVLRTEDPAAVEGRLDRLQKRWTQQNAAIVRATAEQSQQLQSEAAHLQQRGRELLRIAEELTAREAQLSQRQSAWEQQLTESEVERGKLCQQLQSAQVQRQRCERQIAELQAELERLARVLLDEVDNPPRPTAQAA
jgi:hypothetical protein